VVVGTAYWGRLDYEEKLKEMEMMTEATAMATSSTEPMKDIVEAIESSRRIRCGGLTSD
jgi:hypothetical protein